MNTQTRLLRKTALAAAVAIVVSGVASVGDFAGLETGMSPFVSTAYAGDGGSGNGQKGAMGGGRGGQSGQGGKGAGAGGQGQRGGKSVADVLADEADDDSDSDRPDWAGVAGGEGRPGGGGNTDSGTTKGDTYGDMILLVRDPVTGLPVTTDGGWTLACTDVACTPELAVEMVDGEVPEGTTTFEVDLGRGSLVRAPSNVMDSRLEEALSVINSADSISLDEAGRIVVTVDGVTKTIDSPLENLALYIDLMEGLASASTSPTEAALLPYNLANLDTAASLLGGMADKTGDISLDYLMYENLIAGLVAAADEAYDFSSFTYEREYDTTYDFWYSPDGLVAPEQKTLDINAYLDYVNGTLPADGEFAALFAAAADDAVEVIELIHTQIVTDDFLSGFDQF